MEEITKNMIREAANETASPANEKKEEFKLVVKLYDPYTYEDQEITEIDLSGLNEMTAMDMFAVDRVMYGEGYSASNFEISRRYALLTAARINKKPWNFCDKMRARDAVRIKNVVAGFFYMRG